MNRVADAGSTLHVGFTGATFVVTPLAGDSDLVLIPEPRATGLLLAFLVALGGFARRRR